MLELNFDPFPELVTERLLLRKITDDDDKALLEMRSDERVMRFLDRPMAKSIDDVRDLIKRMTDGLEKNEGINWAISLQSSPRLIGTIGFWRTEKENYRGEIGYMLHPDFQKKGIMQEAMVKVLDYGFNTLKLHSVEATVNPLNMSSIKILEKNGFVREAYFKENYFYNGKFLDSAIYSLLNSS